MAVLLFYINAAFLALRGGLLSPFGILIIVGQVACGFGIANGKRWGYVLGVIVASLAMALFVVLPLAVDLGRIFDPLFLINALFPVALFALLVHPMSRSYQRIWFE
jgi:hypothetical protein